MGYLIDGHNLIGQLPDLSLKDPHDEAKLVQKLMGFCARTSKTCIVIFDGGIPGGWSTLSTRPVEVVFASPRTTADRVMRERILACKTPAQLIVVSNDNEVLAAAVARKMKTVKSIDFVPLLQGAAGGTRVPTQAKAKILKEDAGSADHPYVSPNEVAHWLEVFKKKK